MKRREFIQSSAVAAAGILALPALYSCASRRGALGLQLYTLRDSIPQDPKGILKQVAGYGYKELEAYSYKDSMIFGMPYAEFGAYVKDLGMKVVSGHYSLDQLQESALKKAIDDAKAIGQSYIVIAFLEETVRTSLDDYKRICAQFNKAGEICNENGIRFGYHNHAFEFQSVEGRKPYDLMLEELDPGKVSMEMDIFWVVRAGADPLAYFDQHPGRFEQWHVKDMDKNDRDRNADIGTGSIDFKPIFAAAGKSGMKHWYVEEETYPGQPIDSVAASAEFLKKNF
jgi:sugar phosphate isomerase/epimerase